VTLAKRLERLEAEMRRQTQGEEPWLVYRLRDWAEGCPVAFEDNEADEEIARWSPIALDRLVAAGKIREIDRERVTFIVRTIVHPPKYPDDPRRNNAA
jgi:hypothetical protein